MTRLIAFCVLLASLVGLPAWAQNPLEPGWTLQNSASSLRFQSVKKQTVVESSSFATFSGTIAPDGAVDITVALDSVDTKIDLRNVRMRFLFFETFTFPQATIRAQIDPASIADLATTRRKTMTLPVTIDLHGVSKEYTAEVAVTLISDDLVSVASVAPVSIAVADHNLSGGIQKLQEAAKVDIIPSGSVTFDFLFARDGGGTAAPAVAEAAPEPPRSVALEAEGNFDPEACKGRFEILSATGNIFFAPASARLDAKSNALLDQIHDIVSRCPGMVIEIGGHTDSDGSDATNQALSERRALAVQAYLEAKGVPRERLVVKGYGEAAPFVPNDSSENKARNRRIEFKVLG
jgi:OOP family OmpA-OmpF porin